MARKLQEQELHELFHENLPPISVPPALAIQLRQQVLGEVNRRLESASDEAIESTRPADVEHVGFPAASEPAARATDQQRRSWPNLLGDWFSSLRPATSMMVAAATVAALVVFVIIVPRFLPGILRLDIETGSSLDPLPTLAPIEPALMPLSVQVFVGDSTAQVVRGESGLTEIVPANGETILAAGDSLSTDGGSAEIRFAAEKTTVLEAGTQVRLETLAEANGGTQVVLQIESGSTYHVVAAEQPAVDQFELQTSLMTASVVDQADFTVDVQPDGTALLTTYAGEVLVTRTQDDQTAQIGADEQLVVTADDALVVQALVDSSQIALAPTSSPTPSPTPSLTALFPTPTTVSGAESIIPASSTPTTQLTTTATPQTIAMAPDVTAGRPSATATAISSPQMRQTSTVAATSVRTTPVKAKSTVITSTPTTGGGGDRGMAQTASRTPTSTSTPRVIVTSATPTRTPTSKPTATATPLLRVTATGTPRTTTANASLLLGTSTPTKTNTPRATATPTKTNTPRVTATSTKTPRPISTAVTLTAVTSTATTSTMASPTSTLRPTATPTTKPTSTLPAPTAIVNRRPSLQDDTRPLLEDASVDVPVLANDSDPDGMNLSIAGVGSPLHGTATINDAGTAIVYVPAPDFAGVDFFTYDATDGELTSRARVTVNVIPVNDAPSFVLVDRALTFKEDDGASTVAGWARTISSGASNETSQTVRFELETYDKTLFDLLPSIDPTSGDLTFTLAPDAYGTTGVSVVLVDNGGTVNLGNDRSEPQTFAIEIVPVNDAPTFMLSQSRVTLTEDAGSHFVPNLATAISPGADNEADQRVVFEIGVDNEGFFAVPPAINSADGGLTFAVAPDAFGTALLSIELVDDGGKRSAVQTFTIVVDAVDDVPSFGLRQAEVSANEDDGPRTFMNWATDISAGAENESGQRLVFEVETDNGQLFAVLPAIDPGSGDLTFTTAPNAHGRATVTVQLVDEGGQRSAPQTFTIVVESVNDAPTFGLQPGEVRVAEDGGPQSRPNWATNISAGAENESAQRLEFELETFELETNGGALFEASPTVDPGSGDLTFSTAPNAHGRAMVSLRLVDEGGQRSTPQTFTIVVDPINDRPIAVNDSFTLDAGNVLTANVIAGAAGGQSDSDPDGDRLTVVAVIVNGLKITASESFTFTLTSGATVAMKSDGSFTYDSTTRNTTDISDEFLYTVDDGNGSTSGEATVRILP